MDRSVFTLSILPKASFIGVDMVTVTFCATSPLPLAVGVCLRGDHRRPEIRKGSHSDSQSYRFLIIFFCIFLVLLVL